MQRPLKEQDRRAGGGGRSSRVSDKGREGVGDKPLSWVNLDYEFPAKLLSFGAIKVAT